MIVVLSLFRLTEKTRQTRELNCSRFPQAPEHDERYRKLQTERDNLQLQVQVLTEQIEAQGDKISDLEKALSEKKQQLVNAEDMLQRVRDLYLGFGLNQVNCGANGS